MKTIIFTDGASRGNPGRGGWGAIVATNEAVWEIGGREDKTTNNRMELSAAIGALELCVQKNLSSVILYTDSSYLVQGATLWVHGWKRNGWMTKSKEPVLNKILWERLSDLLGGISVEWKRVDGHVGIPANERCDEIATSYADEKDITLFHGSRKEYPVSFEVDETLKKSEKKKSKNTGKAFSYVSMIKGDIKTHQTWSECEDRVKGEKGARFKKVFSKDEESQLIAEWRRG